MKIVSLLRASISFLLIYIVFPLEAQQNNVHLTWDINLSEKTDSKELLIPFKCDDCEAHRKPKAKRPSAVPKTYRFNHVVGIDLLTTRDPDGVACFFLNAICWGTSLQQVKISAETTPRPFSITSRRRASPPRRSVR